MNETSFRCPTSRGNQSRVVPTYHQDEDDQDAHAIQDDNPSIATLIHVEYSRDDISKTETPIVIEEDETLMVEATTKLHKEIRKTTAIKPREPKTKKRKTTKQRTEKEKKQNEQGPYSSERSFQHQIVPVSRDKFPTYWSCASPLHNSFDTHDLIRVVPTYYQDEDDQDAQHQAIQDDNPTITELIHVEYSLDDISKTETPIVIEEDETLMVEATTKLHKEIRKTTAIKPREPKTKKRKTTKQRTEKEKKQNEQGPYSSERSFQHQIVPMNSRSSSFQEGENDGGPELGKKRKKDDSRLRFGEQENPSKSGKKSK
ncbi:hypothetical protein Tco_0365857 [Tanacetum coccineum]